MLSYFVHSPYFLIIKSLGAAITKICILILALAKLKTVSYYLIIYFYAHYKNLDIFLIRVSKD